MKKMIEGKVVSVKMQGTVVVEVKKKNSSPFI